MKPYSALTELGQARRLRLLTNDMNGIFRVDTTDGRKFILRVTLPKGGHNLDHVAAGTKAFTAETNWIGRSCEKWPFLPEMVRQPSGKARPRYWTLSISVTQFRPTALPSIIRTSVNADRLVNNWAAKGIQ